MLTMVLLFLGVGICAGGLAGLLGIGGGVIAVPALYYILGFYGIPDERLMHVAAATALASTFVSSLSSSWLFYLKKEIVPSVLKFTIPGIIMGSGLGVFLIHFLSTSSLRVVFGGMALLFAVYYFFPKLPQLRIALAPNRSLILFGFIFGALSSLLGVGSGLFMFPILLGYRLSISESAGTSSIGTLVSALVGSLAYLYIGRGDLDLPHTIGYIQIPAFLGIGFSSFFTAWMGAKLTPVLPTAQIKRVFAVALAFTGIVMILGK